MRASAVAAYIDTRDATWVSGSPSEEMPIAAIRLLNPGFDLNTRSVVIRLGTSGRSVTSIGLSPWISRRASTTFGSYQWLARRLMSSTPSIGVITDLRYNRAPVIVSNESATDRILAPNGITFPRRPAG